MEIPVNILEYYAARFALLSSQYFVSMIKHLSSGQIYSILVGYKYESSPVCTLIRHIFKSFYVAPADIEGPVS